MVIFVCCHPRFIKQKTTRSLGYIVLIRRRLRTNVQYVFYQAWIIGFESEIFQNRLHSMMTP